MTLLVKNAGEKSRKRLPYDADVFGAESPSPTPRFLRKKIVCDTEPIVIKSVRYRLRDSGGMASKGRREEYVAKAKEAEEQAEKVKDEASKASWLRIAAGHHDLAARQSNTE
jgi:hypothetical protein